MNAITYARASRARGCAQAREYARLLVKRPRTFSSLFLCPILVFSFGHPKRVVIFHDVRTRSAANRYTLSTGVSTFTRFANFPTPLFESPFNVRSVYKSTKSFFNRSPNPGNVVDRPQGDVFVHSHSIHVILAHSKTNSLTPAAPPTKLGSNIISGAINRSLSTLNSPSSNKYNSALPLSLS